MNTQDKIKKIMKELTDILLEKNRKYGDSAISPIRVFSKINTEEQILVRLDDKLSRVKNRQNDDDEDVINDLIGYLVLLKVVRNELV